MAQSLHHFFNESASKVKQNTGMQPYMSPQPKLENVEEVSPTSRIIIGEETELTRSIVEFTSPLLFVKVYLNFFIIK